MHDCGPTAPFYGENRPRGIAPAARRGYIWIQRTTNNRMMLITSYGAQHKALAAAMRYMIYKGICARRASAMFPSTVSTQASPK